MRLRNKDLIYAGISGVFSGVGWRAVEWLTEELYKTDDKVASLLYRSRDVLKIANSSGLDLLKPQDIYNVQRVSLETANRILDEVATKRPDLGISNYIQQVGEMIKGIDTNSISSSLVKDTANGLANNIEMQALGLDPWVVGVQIAVATLITLIPTYYTAKYLYHAWEHRKST